jgi:tetraacyldisaccharide 4'-kinase
MQIIRKLLFPLSIIYGCIAFIRNKCYDIGLFKTTIIPKKSICIGNLNSGGTGKTPHVAYLAAWLAPKYSTSILSRGYGRTTKGFQRVNTNSTAEEVGDEPLFYKQLFNDQVEVVVCEKRALGIQYIQQLCPKNELILLDDAFQHRAVKAGLNIVLTDYNSPFSRDTMLPTGNLREWKSGKNRADIIIVTKCPDGLSETTKNALIQELNVPRDKVFFSQIAYSNTKCFGRPVQTAKTVLLVTGIAQPFPLLNYLKTKYTVEHLSFPDHHYFNREDCESIHRKFDTFAPNETIILTTEKDFMRLKNVLTQEELKKYPWYFQPITVEIDNETTFKTRIENYVNTI